MRKADQIAYGLLCVGGIYILINSLKLGYMKSGKIGPGFFPFWVGLLLALLAGISFIYQLIKNNKEKDSEDKKFTDKKEIMLLIKVMGGAAATIIITPITGFYITLGLMSGYLGKVYGAKKRSTIVLLVVAIPVFLYLVFGVAFGITVPTGIFRF